MHYFLQVCRENNFYCMTCVRMHLFLTFVMRFIYRHTFMKNILKNHFKRYNTFIHLINVFRVVTVNINTEVKTFSEMMLWFKVRGQHLKLKNLDLLYKIIVNLPCSLKQSSPLPSEN